MYSGGYSYLPFSTEICQSSSISLISFASLSVETKVAFFLPKNMAVAELISRPSILGQMQE